MTPNAASVTIEAVGLYLERIIPELESKQRLEFRHDSSTKHLIRRYRQLK